MKGYLVLDYPGKDFETITVEDTALGLTASNAASAKGALITIEDAGIRYRLDGTAPDANTGHPVAAGGTINLRGRSANCAQLTNFKMIRANASNATAMVTYY